MTTKRTWYAADKVGFHMLHSLFQHSLRFDRIVRYDEYFVTKLLVLDGRVHGVAALDVREGVVRAILGRSVILATGGAGKAFPFTTNGNIKTGDGMALAYREGVPLKDMEFVQYHPTGLPGTGILITEASRGEGGYLRNKDGERFLVTRDYGVGKKAELGPRDMISRAIMREIQAGRGVEGPYGEHVLLDLRHLGEDEDRHAASRSCASSRGPTPSSTRSYEPIPIRPVLHYMMGGVDTDIDGATTLPGLYAAGETACGSINGANRLGSNSLTECLVFGARAGAHAVHYARGAGAPDEARARAQADEEAARIDGLRGAGRGDEQIVRVREEMNRSMEAGCGVYREQASMARTCKELAGLQTRAERLKLTDRSKVFNTEIVAALELWNLIDVAETIANAAASRKESRGAHACSDYPTRNDSEYLYHTLVLRGPDGRPRLGKKPVTLGIWEPEERKY